MLPLKRVLSFGCNKSSSSWSWYSVSSTENSNKLWLRFGSRWSRAQSGQDWSSRCLELPSNNSSNPPSKERSRYACAMSGEQQLECCQRLRTTCLTRFELCKEKNPNYWLRQVQNGNRHYGRNLKDEGRVQESWRQKWHWFWARLIITKKVIVIRALSV